MSRRPRRSVDPLVALALGYDRMAPGGTIDSESPVRRVKGMAAGVEVVPVVAPTFVERDQWIEHAVTSFEMHDGGTYSPAFGTFDKAWCWIYTYTTTFTPPSGWTTLWSGTHNGVQFWLGWVDNADAGTDWTVTYAAAPGYPEGYRTTHCVVEYFTGGTMTPQVMSTDLATDVTTRPTPDYDPAWAHVRQFSTQFGQYAMWADWDDDDSSYHYKAFFSTVYPQWQSRDFFEYAPALRDASGITRFWADLARTTPLTLPTLIQFAIGWA